MTDAASVATKRAAFADAIALSAAREAEERIEAGEDYSNDFARVMAEARDTYGEGRRGLLEWIDVRGQMMRPALHPLEPLWIDAFGQYYDSGKLIMLARKGLRAGGSSSACPALVRCALFADRHLDAGTIGVIPIMSATRDEADGRFVTIRAYLRACGLTPDPKSRSEDDVAGRDFQVPAGGLSGTFKSKRSNSGGGVILLNDRHGHEIEFRILPALVRHGVGYTGVAGFADESDLWPNDPEHHVNPAERIFDRISERFTTTFPGSEMLIFSASYNPDSAHKRLIDEVLEAERNGSDVPLIHLMRLGAEGASRDSEARRSLAVQIKSKDPRLLEPGDPMSPDLPAWVFNPIQASIDKCYAFSKGNLGRMLGHYGGRASENARENAPMSDVDPIVDERAIVCADVVVGVAPPDPETPGWGIVAVGLATSGGLAVVEDASGTFDGHTAAEHLRRVCTERRGTVLAVASAQAPLVEGEVAAAFAGLGVAVAPVAPVAVTDGKALRVGPLRTLYIRRGLRHGYGLDALTAAVRGWTPDKRIPRIEALVAAVTRLVACYPQLAGLTQEEPIRGPRATEATYSGEAYSEVLRRKLGGSHGQ